jgi:hypothetical protein
MKIIMPKLEKCWIRCFFVLVFFMGHMLLAVGSLLVWFALLRIVAPLVSQIF